MVAGPTCKILRRARPGPAFLSSVMRSSARITLWHGCTEIRLQIGGGGVGVPVGVSYARGSG
jgi:hypothetical protein